MLRYVRKVQESDHEILSVYVKGQIKGNLK